MKMAALGFKIISSTNSTISIIGENLINVTHSKFFKNVTILFLLDMNCLLDWEYVEEAVADIMCTDSSEAQYRTL
jgi:hypothetical protein